MKPHELVLSLPSDKKLSYETIVQDLNNGTPHLDFSATRLTKHQLKDLESKVVANSFIGHITWGALPTKGISKIVKRIEDQLIHNNKNYKSHPTDFIHGLLSSHSYETSKVGDRVEFTADSTGENHVNAKYNQYLKGWMVEKVFQPENADDYYSVLYVNHKDRQAVIAHRGTDIPGSIQGKNLSLKADLVEILNNSIGVQQVASYVSTKESLELIQQLGYNFSTTGHSLGAWLAELSLYFCHKDFSFHKVRAVTFDSPGSKEQIDSYKPNIHNPKTRIDEDQFDMITYLSAPNIVNVCNEHYGNVIRVNPKIKSLRKDAIEYVRKKMTDSVSSEPALTNSECALINYEPEEPPSSLFCDSTKKTSTTSLSISDNKKFIATIDPTKYFTKNSPVLKILPDIIQENIIKIVKDAKPWNNSYLNSLLSVSGHALNPIIDTFDPVTGKPHPDKCALVKDWPLLHHEPDNYRPVKTLCQYLVDNAPYVKSLPISVRKAVVKAIDNMTTNHTINIIAVIVAGYFKGNTAITQLCNTFNHFDLDTHEEGFQLKTLSIAERFNLAYQAHYRTEPVDLLTAQLLTYKKGSIDWFLSQVNKCNIASLKSLDEFSRKQLTIIKSGFKIDYKNNEQYISLKEQVIKQQNITSIEQFKNYLARLVEVNSTINELLTNNANLSLEDHGNKSITNDNIIASYLPEKTNSFVGRSEEFDQIGDALSKNQIIVVHGFAKIGKSSTTSEYGHIRQKLGEIVRWFDANTPENIKESYRQLALDLGISAPQDKITVIEDTNIDLAKQELINSVNTAIAKLSKPILLIFDNLENYRDAQEYLSNLPQNLAKVIITSRNSNLLSNAEQRIALKPLSKNDAEAFITSNLGKKITKEKIEELLILLSNKEGEVLPSKLSETVSYLNQHILTPISQSIENIKSTILMQDETSLLIESLKDSSLELKILQYAAFLDCASMSIEIFRELLEVNEEQLQPAIENLQKLSLITLKHPNEEVYLSMSKSIQDAVLSYMINAQENEEQKSILTIEKIQQNLVKSLNHLMPQITEAQNANWQEASVYYPHVQKLLADSEDILIAEKGLLHEKIGNYNKYISPNNQEVLTHNQKALEIYKKVHNEENHPRIALTLSSTGHSFKNLNQNEQSLEYHKQALAMRQELYKDENNGNHLDIAKSLYNIGTCYKSLDQIEESLKYHKQALKMRQKLYKNENKGNHPDVANSLNNVGLAYETLGQMEKSQEYYEKALKMRQKLYQSENNVNHPEVAESLSNTGLICIKLGELDKSINRLLQALEMQMKIYQYDNNGNHIAIVNSLNNVGTVYRSIGDSDRSLKHYEQALKMAQEINKDDYGDQILIANCLNNVGIAHEKRAEFEQGLSCLLQGLEILQKIHQNNNNGNHHNVVIALENIGIAYRNLNHLEKSLEYQDQALKMRYIIEGEQPHIADSLIKIGQDYKSLELMNKYLSYQDQALKMRQNIFKEHNGQHPDIAKSLNDIGITYSTMGELQKGKKLVQQALKMRESLYKDLNDGNHSDIAESLSNMGLIQKNLNQFKKSFEFYKQALEMRQILHKNSKDGNHPDIAQSLSDMGFACKVLGKVDESLKYQEQALKMREAIYKNINNGDHPLIADSLNEVGIIYESLGEVMKGLRYQEQALKMREAIYKNINNGNHPLIAESLHNVGLTYSKLREEKKGLDYQEKALMMKYIIEGNNVDIAQSFNKLAIAYEGLGQTEKSLGYYEQALKIRQSLHRDKNSGNLPDIARSLDKIAEIYEKLLDNNKALELYKQSYSIYESTIGKNHFTTTNVKNKILKLEPKFSDADNIRTIILERGIVDENILTIKKKLQYYVLNKIFILATKDDWSSGKFFGSPTVIGGDWGIRGYLQSTYLEKYFGKKASETDVKIAQMLCFEAMCLGVMKNKDKNCIKEFVKEYPECMAQIIAEHPEYMVDSSIVKVCVQDPQTLHNLLGDNYEENFSGQGNADYEQADPWMEYTKEGIDELLKLRLEAVTAKDVKMIIPNYVYDGAIETMQKIANEICTNLDEKSAVVLNLSNKHWVGLVIKKEAESINIEYLDSEQNAMPCALKEQLLLQIISNYPNHNVQFTEKNLESQKYNNCGPELIENLISCITGNERTIPQEDAVTIHSVLFEDLLIPSLSGETF